MLKTGWFTRILYGLEAWAYGGASAVSGISAGMLAAFASKGVPERKRWYFPNWIDGGSKTRTPEVAGRFRAQHGIAADSLLAVYSGNIGRKQGLEILVEAAVALNDRRIAHPYSPHVEILIIGDGAAKALIAEAVAKSGISGLKMLPLLSGEDYHAVLAAMDVALITQSAGTGQYFFPSKLLSVLAAGRPVVTVADESSELARAVVAGGFGRNVLPGQAAELALALSELAAKRGQLAQLAVQTSWVRQFLRERVLSDYARRLEEITLPKISRSP
jgi:colanic acid biosynthesis glycosyl transferase WcaI